MGHLVAELRRDRGAAERAKSMAESRVAACEQTRKESSGTPLERESRLALEAARQILQAAEAALAMAEAQLVDALAE